MIQQIFEQLRCELFPSRFCSYVEIIPDWIMCLILFLIVSPILIAVSWDFVVNSFSEERISRPKSILILGVISLLWLLFSLLGLWPVNRINVEDYYRLRDENKNLIENCKLEKRCITLVVSSPSGLEIKMTKEEFDGMTIMFSSYISTSTNEVIIK
jgi:hypothetical protein